MLLKRSNGTLPGVKTASANMVAGRPDWCISRQRVWGVPIIVFYCEACSEPFTEKRVLDSVVEKFRGTLPTSGIRKASKN